MCTHKIMQFVAALQPMTRQHSYDEYSLGNGYAYSMVYRYIFRNILHYSLSICVRIGYIWKKFTFFSVFLIFFSFFEKARSFHPWLRCGDRRIDRLSRKKTFMRLTWENTTLDFPQRLNFLKFFLKWDYISLMKWNFFKERTLTFYKYTWLTGIVDMIPPILLQALQVLS